MSDVKLEWKGEKVKQTVNVPDKELTPKEILDSLDHVRNQISQMENQKQELKRNMEQTKDSISQATAFEKERREFEDKCIEIQKDKLKLYISQIHEEMKEKAKKDAEAEIAKDPNAYTDSQKKNMAYLNYQKYLATSEKIAEKISRRIITKYLYEEPIFDNPF